MSPCTKGIKHAKDKMKSSEVGQPCVIVYSESTFLRDWNTRILSHLMTKKLHACADPGGGELVQTPVP